MFDGMLTSKAYHVRQREKGRVLQATTNCKEMSGFRGAGRPLRRVTSDIREEEGYPGWVVPRRMRPLRDNCVDQLNAGSNGIQAAGGRSGNEKLGAACITYYQIEQE